MKQITLTTPEIKDLNLIKEAFANKQPLTSDQQTYLVNFLSQLPTEQNLLSSKIPLDVPLPVNVWDMEKIKDGTAKWIALFESLPDYNHTTFCITAYENEPELIKIGTLVVALFAPTLTYAVYLSEVALDNESFEVHLKDDGTAYFKLPTLQDAEHYPELYNFKGSWKEAYLLLIETLKKGWPMEEFPEELKPFLKKYILRYVIDEKKNHNEQVYTNNLRSNTMSGYVKEFTENEAFRQHSRIDQIHLFHEIVSFGADEDKDATTPEMIGDLAREYMRLRGNTGVMLGAVHRDRSHVHIHFCVSALHYRTGLSFGLSKSRMLELKKSFQDYHTRRYPALTRSSPEHGKGARYQSHAQWHSTQRERIIGTVRDCFARATSQQDFLALLKIQDLHHYERNGIATGIGHDGTKFRFSDLLEPGHLESLPNDRSEEEKTLAEIRSIRVRPRERDSVSRDIEERAI
eukprot:gene7926-7998_t